MLIPLPVDVDAEAASPAPTGPLYHVMLGRNEGTPQYGILGIATADKNRRVALDLTFMHTIGLFGEPEAGKSYCMGTILEMCTVECEAISQLPNPLVSIVFHYSVKKHYVPEPASMVRPNDRAQQVHDLWTTYHAKPKALEDVLILAPKDVVAERRLEFPNVAVAPLTFASRELKAEHWKILMGAVGDDESLYMQVMNGILKKHRSDITLAKLREEVDASYLSTPDKDRAKLRLQLAEHYLDEGVAVGSHLKAGRLVICDLRDEYLPKRDALALMLVLFQIFADVKNGSKPLQKMCTFDEAHKYMKDPALVETLTEAIREMRHASICTMVASQEPESVPQSIINLMSMVIMLKTTSPLSLDNIAAVKPAFRHVKPHELGGLRLGEAMVWSKFATDAIYTERPQRIAIRPRFTKHGGDTKIAVEVKDTVVESAAGDRRE